MVSRRDVYPQTAPGQDETIVTFQGVPLGLAKRVGSRLKNSYPRELVRDGKLFCRQGVRPRKKCALFDWRFSPH